MEYAYGTGNTQSIDYHSKNSDKRDTLRGSISHRETVSPRKKKSVSHFSKSSSLKNLPNNKEKKGGSFYISTKKRR